MLSLNTRKSQYRSDVKPFHRRQARFWLELACISHVDPISGERMPYMPHGKRLDQIRDLTAPPTGSGLNSSLTFLSFENVTPELIPDPRSEWTNHFSELSVPRRRSASRRSAGRMAPDRAMKRAVAAEISREPAVCVRLAVEYSSVSPVCYAGSVA